MKEKITLNSAGQVKQPMEDSTLMIFFGALIFIFGTVFVAIGIGLGIGYIILLR